MYGYPAGDVNQLIEEGKIVLGGCTISNISPEYHCNNCGHEWSKEDAIDAEYKKILGISASVGGFWNGQYNVGIDFTSRELKWSHIGSGHEEHYNKIIRQSTLDKLREELKLIDILKWKSNYTDWDVCDGTQWEIELIREGRNIKKYGSNMFPDSWDSFCRLMSKVSGKSFY
jgi:hypothetical protein